MTPDERNVLQQFLADLDSTRGANKDGEAEGMINGTLRTNPDAAYLLVQHAILADQALQAAQQRISMLEQQQGPEPSSALAQPSSFGAGQPEPQPPAQSPLSPAGGLGGFLKGAGVLAAGVAGGEFLANGLSNLFSPRDW